MKNKPTQPSSPDTDLFRQALEGVTPLAQPDRIAPTRKPHKVPVRAGTTPAEVSDTLSDHGAGDHAITEFLRPGLNRLILRKLRHGEWRIQDELDLHGLNSDAARKLLAEFLLDATQRGLRCINVIHGKGWRSEGRDGILKVLTRYWLAQHPLVLAFCETPPQAGGSGAVWVLLKAQDKSIS
jgi:DNA-nicking Smr family endonuclease